MNSFLVREALGFSEFVEAILLLMEDRMGVRQHEKNFDLPQEEPVMIGGGPREDGTMMELTIMKLKKEQRQLLLPRSIAELMLEMDQLAVR